MAKKKSSVWDNAFKAEREHRARRDAEETRDKIADFINARVDLPRDHKVTRAWLEKNHALAVKLVEHVRHLPKKPTPMIGPGAGAYER